MEFTVYTIPLWIVAIAGAGLAALTAYYHEQKGAYELFALFVGAVFWAGGYAMEFSVAQPQMKIFWYKIHFLGSAIVPTAIFIIALRFTGRDDLIRPKYLAALAVVPVVTAVLILTSHDLWVTLHFMPQPPEAVWPLTHEFGPWYYFYAYYSLAIAVAAIGMFVQAVLERSDESWINTTSAFLVATILPTVGTALYVIGGTTIDYGPFAFLISGLCIMAAMFYF
ncbi:MAG: histidine kinase N-terminal 7TM domain-containing protein [Halorientalis sp.]